MLLECAWHERTDRNSRLPVRVFLRRAVHDPGQNLKYTVKERKNAMAKSKLVKANEKIARKVVGTFEKIEDTVVGGYTKIEETVVDGYTRIEDAFVDRYRTKDGESVEEAKKRLDKKAKERNEEEL